MRFGTYQRQRAARPAPRPTPNCAAIKCSGDSGTANVTVEAAGAVGPVDFIVYRMSGDASIEAFPVRSTASTAPYRHILSFDTNLTNQTKRAVFGCSARDAAGNTGNVVIEVEIFYNEE